MDESKSKKIISLVTKHLFKECDELGIITLAQVHKVIDVLLNANVPFVMSFKQGTDNTAATIQFVITLSPSISLTKVFNLEEGYTGGRALVNLF